MTSFHVYHYSQYQHHDSQDMVTTRPPVNKKRDGGFGGEVGCQMGLQLFDETRPLGRLIELTPAALPGLISLWRATLSSAACVLFFSSILP